MTDLTSCFGSGLAVGSQAFSSRWPCWQRWCSGIDAEPKAAPDEKIALPPMPWYQVQAMSESDLRSLYLYIKSLGASGELPPFYREPGKEPRTPYVTLEPPQSPKKK